MTKFYCFKNTVLLFVLAFLSCANQSHPQNQDLVRVGANRTELYLPQIRGKNIGVIANQTSVIFKTHQHQKGTNLSYTHLVDSLLNLGIKINKVFAPEHGYRGLADAGEHIKNGVDTKTGIPIVSLYGQNRKPKAEDLMDLEIIIFDIQDVGARFYTFLSTLHFMMEVCAELNIPILILDHPNPNGHYVDGPILELENSSFVGLHPVPIVHGMTVGEYATMINGEGWLKDGLKCELIVIPVAHYNRSIPYHLPIAPSPNLPNAKSINLYPSLCLFEGTNVSVGRGTDLQFQIYGSPYLDQNIFDFTFKPSPKLGAKHPKNNNILCFGENLSSNKYLQKIELEWLLKAYQHSSNRAEFFNSFFTKLAGTKKLQKQIEEGWSAENIIKSWRPGLETFKAIRSNYLLYP